MHKVFSLQNLVSWTEQQPAEKEYDFWCDRCYLGQYFEAHGFKIRMIGVGTVTFKGRHKARALPPHFGDIAMTRPHTFGAALDRAKVALSSKDHA